MRNFNEIYEAMYRSCAEPMEKLRTAARNRIVLVSIILIAIGITLTVITQAIHFCVFSIAIIFIYVAFSGKRGKYNAIFKEKVVKTFVKEYSENLEYNPRGGISTPEYMAANFESFDRFYSEDCIYGTLEDGYKINMAEVHTERESRDEDGHTSYTTIFRGLFAHIELDKFIVQPIKIRKNAIKIFDKKERIEMDSGEFEKMYDIYSENKIVAMQLLTADIMQMFIDFYEKNKVKPELTIYRNNLYIRFETGNMFEAKIFTKALDYQLLKKYYDTINFTLNITEKMTKNIKETEI